MEPNVEKTLNWIQQRLRYNDHIKYSAYNSLLNACSSVIQQLQETVDELYSQLDHEADKVRQAREYAASEQDKYRAIKREGRNKILTLNSRIQELITAYNSNLAAIKELKKSRDMAKAETAVFYKEEMSRLRDEVKKLEAMYNKSAAIVRKFRLCERVNEALRKEKTELKELLEYKDKEIARLQEVINDGNSLISRLYETQDRLLDEGKVALVKVERLQHDMTELQWYKDFFDKYFKDNSPNPIDHLVNKIGVLEEVLKKAQGDNYPGDPRMPLVDHFQLELERLIDKYSIDSMDVLGCESLSNAQLIGTIETVKLNYHNEMLLDSEEDDEEDEHGLPI